MEAAPEAAAEPALVEVWRPGGRSEERRPRHDRSRHRHHKADGAQAASPESSPETGEGAKPERHRRGRHKRDRESGPSHRQYATSAAPRERDRPADPNSPFAKLAALKEQLARKE